MVELSDFIGIAGRKLSGLNKGLIDGGVNTGHEVGINMQIIFDHYLTT